MKKDNNFSNFWSKTLPHVDFVAVSDYSERAFIVTMSDLIARGLGLVEIVDDVTGPRVLNAFRKLSNKPENEQE